jgi:T4-like virus Myoviridae tail sheath stabiliser
MARLMSSNFGMYYITSIQVMQYLSSLKIARKDQNGDNSAVYDVRTVAGEKDAVVYDMMSGNPPKFANKMPFIVVEQNTGTLTYASDRERNPNDRYYRNYSDNGYPINRENYRPQPVNLSYKVTVFARFQEDMEQILQNILFWFRPYVTVRMDTLNLIGYETDPEKVTNIRLMWDGSAAGERFSDKDKVPYWTSTMTFTAETYNWMFTEAEYGPIMRIYQTFKAFNGDPDLTAIDASVVTFGTTSTGVDGEQILDVNNVRVVDVDVVAEFDHTSMNPAPNPSYLPNPSFYDDNTGINFGNPGAMTSGYGNRW